jgi:hypothetical protein
MARAITQGFDVRLKFRTVGMFAKSAGMTTLQHVPSTTTLSRIVSINMRALVGTRELQSIHAMGPDMAAAICNPAWRIAGLGHKPNQCIT